MPPRSASHRSLQRRLRRTMNYGQLRMDNLTVPLTEMVVDYFDRHNSFERLDLGFAAKVARECAVDPTTLIVAMIYIDRLRRASTASDFSNMTPEDLYLGTLVLATKFLQDSDMEEYIWNDEWAQCSSRHVKDINVLELELLSKLDWNVNVREDEFRAAVEATEDYIALSCLRRHKFLTYNDLTVLARNWDKFWSEIKMFFTFTTAISMTYFSAVFVGIAIASTQSGTTIPTTSNNGSCAADTSLSNAFFTRLEHETAEHEKRFVESFSNEDVNTNTNELILSNEKNESCISPNFIDGKIEPIAKLSNLQDLFIFPLGVKCC